MGIDHEQVSPPTPQSRLQRTGFAVSSSGRYTGTSNVASTKASNRDKAGPSRGSGTPNTRRTAAPNLGAFVSTQKAPAPPTPLLPTPLLEGKS